MNELNHLNENISGIYNYCDRWCEKCAYTNRCLLFKKEAERNIKHILNDEDPNDPEVFSKDIADSFQEGFDMLSEKMKDVEFNDLFDEEDIESFEEEEALERESFESTEKNSIVTLTQKFFDEFTRYFSLIKTKYPLVFETDSPDNELQEQIHILAWYSPQINVKSRMCVWGKEKLLREKDPDIKETDEEMLNVDSRITITGIEKSILALESLINLAPELQTETLEMLIILKNIKDLFIQEYPNSLTFKRPFFD